MKLRNPASWLIAFCLVTALGVAAPAYAQGQEPQDWKDRDSWQRPEAVMDALGLRAGGVVADVGCGRGYFAFRLARRVGAQGKVYAEDIKSEDIDKVRSMATAEGLSQIETILGAPDDPHLPAGALDAVLVVKAYHEMPDFDAMLEGLFRALMPGGRLGIIDREAEPGKPRGDYYDRHRIPAGLVRDDAMRHGFRFLRDEPGFTDPDDGAKLYFLLFEKPGK
jgi:predicted methyltransferase